jgi:hypothetical protein
MLKLLLRYGAQALVVAAPWLAGHFGWGLSETDQKVLLSLVGLILVLAYDAWDLYVPRQQLRRFGKKYCEKLAEHFNGDGYPKLGEDLRLNIMYVRGVWPFRWFRWLANFGFAPAGRSYKDSQLFLFTWQGVAGKAVAERAHYWADLRDSAALTTAERWLFKNRFRLAFWQLSRTSHVLAILSVPLFREVGEKPNIRSKLVGVINLDAVSPTGAAWLSSEDTRVQMVKFLADYGAFLAFLD